MNTDKIYAEQLANEYALKDTSKVIALRKLDAKAKLPATVFTYTFGIITALVAGVGMCLSMKVIGSGSTTMFVLGVIVGIIGLLGMGVNYPIYKKLLAQGKQKYAFEIMELAKEISLPELPQSTGQDAGTGPGTEKCGAIFLRRKRTPPRKRRPDKRIASRRLLPFGQITRVFLL